MATSGSLRAWCIVAGLTVLTGVAIGIIGPPASAAGFDDAVAELAVGSFEKKIQAIDDLAATGDDRAAAVLRAMLEGELYSRRQDGRVVIARKSGAAYVLRDPGTGAEIGDASGGDIKKIRVNNRLRTIIRGALGGLTLMSASREKRMAAADAIFKTPAEDSLALLEKALARETDDAVRNRIERALAATRLTAAADPAVRLSAIPVLTRHADPEVRALLGRAARPDGGNQDASVRAAAAAALATVEQELAMWELLGALFQGVSLGSVLLLAAIGLAITFGVMGVINMAHGELVMLGAYTTFVVQEAFRGLLPEFFDMSVLVAIPLAFVVSGLFGIAIERGIIRFLYGRPLETLLATWGISLILQQLVRSIFGATNREVGNPSWMSGAVEVTGGLVLTYNRIWIVLFGLLVVAGVALVLRRTRFGLHMRAVTQNRAMASSMGIHTGRTDALTFGLGAGIAGVAGVALSQIDNVSPNLGQSYIIDSFMVVVFGGVGNLWGTLVGAFTLGIVNKFLEPFAGAVLGKIIVLVVIILFIQKRPRGLFALKGRAVEN